VDLEPLLEKLEEIEGSRDTARDEANSAENSAQEARGNAEEAYSYANTADDQAAYAASYADDCQRSLNTMEDEIADLRKMLKALATEEDAEYIAEHVTTKLELPDTSTAVLNRDGSTSSK